LKYSIRAAGLMLRITRKLNNILEKYKTKVKSYFNEKTGDAKNRLNEVTKQCPNLGGTTNFKFYFCNKFQKGIRNENQV